MRWLLLILAACGGGTSTDAATPDAATPDAATPDAATPDATMPDAAMPDAAPPVDAGPDAPPIDAPPQGAQLVVATSPRDGEPAAELTAAIEVQFTTVVDLASVSASSFVVARDGVPIAGTAQRSDHGDGAIFRPAAPLERGAVYTATLSTEIKTWDGIPLQAPYSWTFTAATLGWESAPSMPGARSLALVRGGDGVFTLLWFGGSAGQVELWASRFTPAGTWLAPARLATSTELGDVELATNASGDVVVVWTARPAPGWYHRLHAARFTPAGGWSAPAAIDAADTWYAHDPQVGLDDAGNAFVAWTQRDGSWANAYARRQLADGTWQAPVLLEHDDFHVDDDEMPPEVGHPVYFPQLAVDRAGNATVAWWQSGEHTTHLWSVRFTPATGWSERAMLAAEPGHDLHLLADDAGVVHAIWKGGYYPDWSLRSSRHAGGAWTPWAELDRGRIVGVHAPVVDASGAVTVAWTKGAFTAGVFAGRYVPGAGWCAPAELGVRGASPVLGVDAAGTVHALWSWETNQEAHLVARRFVPGVGWKAPMAVHSVAGPQLSTPLLAVQPDGTAAAAWTRTTFTPPNTTAQQLWFARFY